ncbi:MAG TPA: S41 family peptidase, partial [Halanaerobiales bacterium]|nr:S41 family peptidase [Halanaerobiales bacterium]
MKKMKARVVILTVALVLFFTAGLRAENEPFDIFQEVLFYIQYYHIEEQDQEELFKGAIRGMVETLDIFSSYMTEEEYEEMQLEMEGHFGGIGISINPDLVIVAPIRGTPGEKVGLQSEDKIIAIDGEPTDDMTQQEAVSIMRGEPGTEVTLTIRREGVEEGLEFHIVRSDIEIPYVESELIDNRIAYISIAQFAQDVGGKVERAISELESQGAEALILDLRTNPGGLLSEAINVSSNFFDNGEVVSIRKRYGADEVLQVEKGFLETELPVLVLINQG